MVFLIFISKGNNCILFLLCYIFLHFFFFFSRENSHFIYITVSYNMLHDLPSSFVWLLIVSWCGLFFFRMQTQLDSLRHRLRKTVANGISQKRLVWYMWVHVCACMLVCVFDLLCPEWPSLTPRGKRSPLPGFPIQGGVTAGSRIRVKIGREWRCFYRT